MLSSVDKSFQPEPTHGAKISACKYFKNSYEKKKTSKECVLLDEYEGRRETVCMMYMGIEIDIYVYVLCGAMCVYVVMF